MTPLSPSLPGKLVESLSTRMSELLEDLPGSHSLASYDKLQHLDDENGNIEGEIERER